MRRHLPRWTKALAVLLVAALPITVFALPDKTFAPGDAITAADFQMLWDEVSASGPLGESEVDAFVSNNGYLQDHARTRYYAIPALAFWDQDVSQLVQRTNWGTLYFGASTPADTTAYLTAPVIVPHGSTITAVRCDGRHTDPNDTLAMALWRTSGAGSAASRGDDTASTGDLVVMELTGLDESVDLTNRSYYLAVTMATDAPGASEDRLRLNDCRVTYTVNDL